MKASRNNGNVRVTISDGKYEIEIPIPSNIDICEERIIKEKKDLDGSVIIDLIGAKKSYDITWDIMEIDTLKRIKRILENDKVFFNLKINLECNSVSDEGARRVVSTDTISSEGYLTSIKYTPYFYNNKYVWLDVSMKVAEK